MSSITSNPDFTSNLALLPPQVQPESDAIAPTAASASRQPPGAGIAELASFVPPGGLHPVTQTPETESRFNFMAQATQEAQKLDQQTKNMLKQASIKS